MVGRDRLPNESEYEFIYRICSVKDTIGTWDDVAEVLNNALGYEYTSCKYRKDFAAFSKMFSANADRLTDAGSVVADIEEQRRLLQRERYKYQAAKLDATRQERQESRFELFYENIRDVIRQLPVPELRPIPPYAQDNMRWVCGMGDIHYGAKYKSENNEYSPEICAERLEKLLGELQAFVVKEGVDTLTLVNLGDSIQGILRISDLTVGSIPVVEAVVGVSRLISAFLNQLSAYCNVEYYHVGSANHSQIRPLASKANELAAEDLERVIASYISDVLADNGRIHVYSNFESEYLPVDGLGFEAIAFHGHQVKNVRSAIKDLSNLHRKLYDYVFVGHLHESNQMPCGEGEHHNIKILRVPSICGSDPYGDSLMVGSKAGADLFGFDPVYGHVETKHIILN